MSPACAANHPRERVMDGASTVVVRMPRVPPPLRPRHLGRPGLGVEPPVGRLSHLAPGQPKSLYFLFRAGSTDTPEAFPAILRIMRAIWVSFNTKGSAPLCILRTSW